MATNLEKLRGLLQELFQLDQADLDFGIYRIMNQKRDEVVRFLDKDLFPQVQSAFKHYKSADKSVLQNELDKLIGNITNAGMNPDESPKVKELRQQIEGSAVDVTALENDVFSHLFNFFRRYYSEGDFISLRRYKEGVYAIPYEGEEVKLHWANADQYYVKSSETFRDYTFKVAGDKRVRVHLVAASTEQDNNKAAPGKERRFVLADKPLSEENDELFVRFEYRLYEGKEKQDELNKQAIEAVLKTTGFEKWSQELAKLAPTEKNKSRTVLEKHLDNYTKRNTFDYFIHKDLGGFLRRELDFYIKNEVMHLDDIEHEVVPKVEQYLSQIKVIRSIAHKIIQFLEQLENFQKKLWLKKKFVIETNYCITLDRVPEVLYPEIAKNDAQREEWVRLFAIDEIERDTTGPGYSEPLTVEFLKNRSSLMLDTKHFNSNLRDKLLSAIADIGEGLTGLTVNSDNAAALRLLEPSFKGRIGFSYIDPPYNTGEDGFPYKDAYQHSSWLAMMQERLALLRRWITELGAIGISIGREELFNLEMLCDQVLGASNRLGDLVWEKGRKNDAKYFSLGHDYILVYGRSKEALDRSGLVWREEKPGAASILDEYKRLRELHEGDIESIQAGIREFYKSLPEDDPSLKHKRYNRVDNQGIWRDDNISWPGGGGPRYDVIHPITKQPCKVPDRGWVFSSLERFKLYEEHGFIEYREDHSDPPLLKRYLNHVPIEFDPEAKRRTSAVSDEDGDSVNVQVMPSVFYKNSQPTIKEFRHLMGDKPFPNPKDPEVIARLIKYLAADTSWVVDAFGGSGTTGHAVISSNLETKAGRRFLLMEMGMYHDEVLLPRIKRVIYSSLWKDGKPLNSTGASQFFKYIRLESYEDALNNLELKRSSQQDLILDDNPDVREQYLLSYMLDVESRGSQSLLNVDSFRNPYEYKLRVERNGETQLVNVDLVETFNWLLGLTVKHIDVIPLKKDGPSVRVVEGTAPNGDRVLVLWRNIDQMDNDTLDKWFEKQDYNTREMVYDVFYVNGDNNLENLRRLDQTWKVRLIEEEFQRLMFDVEDV